MEFSAGPSYVVGNFGLKSRFQNLTDFSLSKNLSRLGFGLFKLARIIGGMDRGQGIKD